MKRLWIPLLVVLSLLLSLPLTALADETTTDDESGVVMAASAPLGLRLRKTPGLSGTVILTLDCAEQVTVIDGLDTGIIASNLRWVEVSVERDGRTYTGYVAYKYLSEDLSPNCYFVAASWYWPRPPAHHPGCGHPCGGPPNGGPGNPPPGIGLPD